MKIEINIDAETIVREEIRNLVRENLVITVPGSKSKVINNTKTVTRKVRTPVPKGITWEFAPKSGRRRSAAEIAMHKLELKHGRLLTPEEKGETKAFVQIDEDAELKAKETTLNKVRIEEIAAEGMAAASKELAEEEKKERRDPDSINANGCMDRAEDKIEAKIPKTEKLKGLNSLFS